MATNTVSTSNKILWIDIAKGICILLVYLNHSEIYLGVSNPCFRALYSPFFVNLFFIISGYLLFKKHFMAVVKNEKFNGGGYLRNVLFRIFIPSIVFSTLIYFPKMVIRGQEINALDFVEDTFLGEAMWFTSALVVAQLLLFILLKCKVRNIAVYVLWTVILTCIANLLTTFGCTLNYFYFRSGMIASLFLVFGGIYLKYENKISNLLRNKWCVYINIFLFITYVYMAIRTDIFNCSVNSGYVNFCGIIAASYISILIISAIKKLSDITIISYIGKNSILFYFLSGGIPNVLAIIAYPMVPHNYLGVSFVCISSLVIAYIASIIINKYFLWLTDFRRLKK